MYQQVRLIRIPRNHIRGVIRQKRVQEPQTWTAGVRVSKANLETRTLIPTMDRSNHWNTG